MHFLCQHQINKVGAWSPGWRAARIPVRRLGAVDQAGLRRPWNRLLGRSGGAAHAAKSMGGASNLSISIRSIRCLRFLVVRSVPSAKAGLLGDPAQRLSLGS
jgi:hypothetical protein